MELKKQALYVLILHHKNLKVHLLLPVLIGVYMDTFEAILTRRSIRKYENKPISDDQIKELLNAAMSAPSAGNQQPWHFVIMDDKNIFKELPKFHPSSEMLMDAQKAILVCGDLKLDKHKDMWIQDCSAATQNILLAARAIGLGSCWLGVYPREQRIQNLRNLLNIPKNVIPFSIISLGYPAEKQKEVNRYKDSRIHINKW
jgi:nitroreductase